VFGNHGAIFVKWAGLNLEKQWYFLLHTVGEKGVLGEQIRGRLMAGLEAPVKSHETLSLFPAPMNSSSGQTLSPTAYSLKQRKTENFSTFQQSL